MVLVLKTLRMMKEPAGLDLVELVWFVFFYLKSFVLRV